MNKIKKQKVKSISLGPNYNPDSVIEVRTYGVKDLKRYIGKIQKNIKVFEEAIKKERAEMKKTEGMITVLETDIKQAKLFKRLKGKKIE